MCVSLSHDQFLRSPGQVATPRGCDTHKSRSANNYYI